MNFSWSQLVRARASAATPRPRATERNSDGHATQRDAANVALTLDAADDSRSVNVICEVSSSHQPLGGATARTIEAADIGAWSIVDGALARQ